MRSLAAVIGIWALVGPSAATAAPVLRSAEVDVTMSSNTCLVTMRFTVEGAVTIDHRIDSTTVDLIEVGGAQAEAQRDVQAVGRTRSLMLRPTTGSYHLRYTALLPQHRAYRCPLWLPTIPADGQSRAIAIHVELPAGAVPGADSMPAVTWSERRGEATLGHLPVFLYVPFTAEGVTAPWSVSRTVDAFTIAIIVFASAVWMWMRKRGHHASRKAS